MKPFWQSTDHIVLAVSTGIDSMVLLHQLLTEYADTYQQLTCLHVHHGLREASDQEAKFLEAYCQERGVPLHIHYLDLTEETEAGRSIQNEARQLRYAWFDDMVRNLQADYLLTAHHQDDQLETIFYRIFTGRVDRSSLGIPSSEQREGYRLIRPLITTTKAQIHAYQQQHAVPYFEDESNQSNAYVRNDIRNRLLPRIEENPHLQSEQLLKLMSVHEEALALFTEQARQFISREVIQKGTQHWEVPRKTFNQLSPHVKMKVLDELLLHFESVVTVSERTYQDWFVKLHSDVAQTTLMHTNRWHVDIVYDKLVIVPAKTEIALSSRAVTTGGTYDIGSYHIEIAEDIFRLHPVLYIRTRQTGDRVKLSNGHHKKVTRLMIDQKVPRGQREQMPIVTTDQDEILAVGTCYQHATYHQYIHIQYLGDDINEK
ncbi:MULTISPECIES: tRNA lysidine(34) synthetase TilS [unclassified Staphylococcus]|uniref:tRNA lysidine(34) synthetase TilS n=1 Tax=unclassified Staphylococcus TaxID=91994 RepID=UPI0021CF58C0|nr:MULTISPECIES: tRNA lysidine(34) synthetase TilS [unclassified Staphylococcus]UXR69776.1 tRNA lysidine(34) synthetase TilS [Staphylococcus sp. IVB6246]UXR71812.1 tRNA lysidine(34) synthetase TilS [Staphylococcus sp. IVB6240]UXR76508.1 tRNA lysidine(34) synthetase TilS [Staphylococcus sp. IVB6233]UXR80635.1 tRNA lysidine(34) synthetase TilS [Staphylococcus sp. IVB6218]